MSLLRFLCVVWGKKFHFSPPHFPSVVLALLFERLFPSPIEYPWHLCCNLLPVSVYFCLCLFLGSVFSIDIFVLIPVRQLSGLLWLYSKYWNTVVWILPLCSFSRLFDNSRSLACPYKILESNCQILQNKKQKQNTWITLQNPAMPRQSWLFRGSQVRIVWRLNPVNCPFKLPRLFQVQ